MKLILFVSLSLLLPRPRERETEEGWVDKYVLREGKISAK